VKQVYLKKELFLSDGSLPTFFKYVVRSKNTDDKKYFEETIPTKSTLKLFKCMYFNADLHSTAPFISAS
jgi:hypothetical protein